MSKKVIIYNVVSNLMLYGGDLSWNHKKHFVAMIIQKENVTKRNCLGIVAIILLTAFAVVIGLLVGAAVAAAILAALPAVIVLAVILGLLLILTLILILCNRKRDCKERKCC